MLLETSQYMKYRDREMETEGVITRELKMNWLHVRKEFYFFLKSKILSYAVVLHNQDSKPAGKWDSMCTDFSNPFTV